MAPKPSKRAKTTPKTVPTGSSLKVSTLAGGIKEPSLAAMACKFRNLMNYRRSEECQAASLVCGNYIHKYTHAHIYTHTYKVWTPTLGGVSTQLLLVLQGAGSPLGWDPPIPTYECAHLQGKF